MSVETDVYEAAMTVLGAYLGGNPLPTAYPDVGFTPPGTGQWLQVRFFPNETFTYAMKDGPFSHFGFIQITVAQRPGAGLMPILALAEEIRDLYPYNLTLGPGYVRRTPVTASIIEESDRTLCPVTIYYRAKED